MRSEKGRFLGPIVQQAVLKVWDREPFQTCQQVSNRDDLSFASIVRVWWFYRNAVICMTLLALLGAAIIVGMVDREYKTEALVELNYVPQRFETPNIARERAHNLQSRIENNLAFMTANAFFERLADELRLYSDSDFLGDVYPSTENGVLQLHDSEDGEEGSPALAMNSSSPAQTSHAVKSGVVETLADRVIASQRGTSNIISVEVTFRDSEKAAALANTAAKILVADEAERLKTLEARAFEFLARKIRNLRGELAGLEGEMLSLVSKHGLHGTDEDQSMSQATAIQWSEFVTRLALIKAERADLKAKYAETRSGIAKNGAEKIVAITNSPELNELKITETNIERRLSEFKRDLGDNHPTIIGIRNDLAQTRERMMMEAHRIKDALRSELLVAVAREAEIEIHLEQIKKSIHEEKIAGNLLSDLRSRIKQKKSLLKIFLVEQRQRIQKRTIRPENATIISPAYPPTEHEFPRFGPLALYVSVGGALFGLAGVFLFERWISDFGFRSATDLRKSKLGALGIVPNLDAREPEGSSLADYIVQCPQSAQAEGVQRIRRRLVEMQPRQASHAMVILVTSSSPSEGKTSLALALARQSAMAGRRTLLVDADLRSPSIHTMLGLEQRHGLGELLSGDKHSMSRLDYDPLTSLKILQAGFVRQISSDIFLSNVMTGVVRELRQHYDWIFLDSPSLGAVADGLALAKYADLTLYVAHWLATPRNVVEFGTRQLHEVGATLAGVALNRVDMDASTKYRDLDEFKHYGYYQSQAPA